MRYSKIADEIAKEYERKLRFEERRKLKSKEETKEKLEENKYGNSK